MVDVEPKHKMGGSWPWVGAEGPMFVLVLLGAVFIALGFVATSAYYDAMGFPPALFPPESAMLGIMGFNYGIMAIFIVAVVPSIGVFGWWLWRFIVRRVPKCEKKLQILMFIIAFIALSVLVTKLLWLDITSIAVLLSGFILVFSSGSLIASGHSFRFDVCSWLTLCVLLYQPPLTLTGARPITEAD
jgi:hypothetical protein